MDKTKRAGASYIVRFYDDVANLTHYYSLYQSAVLELEARFPNFAEEPNTVITMDDGQKQNFIAILQNVRHHINTSYISYVALLGELKSKGDKKIKEKYEEIKKQYIIEEQDVFKYVTEINAFLLSKILVDLLETSQDLVSDIYGTDKPDQS